MRVRSVEGSLWALLLLASSLFQLYWLAPEVRKGIRRVLHGTALARLAILIDSAAMDLILRFSHPGSAVGAVESVLILPWSLCMVNAIVIVGAIVDGTFGRRRDQTLNVNLHRHPEKRLDHGVIAVTVYR